MVEWLKESVFLDKDNNRRRPWAEELCDGDAGFVSLV